jgi:hypothetical protein
LRIKPAPAFVLPVDLDAVLARAAFLRGDELEGEGVDGPFSRKSLVCEGVLFALAAETQRLFGQCGFLEDLAPGCFEGRCVELFDGPRNGGEFVAELVRWSMMEYDAQFISTGTGSHIGANFGASSEEGNLWWLGRTGVKILEDKA